MWYSQLFLTKCLALGISFSTAVGAVVVAKLVMLGILFLISFFSLNVFGLSKISLVSIGLKTREKIL